MKKQADPRGRVTGPRMNPSVDVGRPPRPFRHLRMAQRRSPDPSSSRAPVHSALVQISVTRHHQLGRSALIWMLGKICEVGKWEPVKSWQEACKQRAECASKKLKTIGEAPEYFRARNFGILTSPPRQNNLSAKARRNFSDLSGER